MSDKVFAFQVARPLWPVPENQEARSAQYDPQTQTMQWQGQNHAQAYFCTAHHNGWWYCTLEGRGTVCFTSGPRRVTGGYICD